MGKGTKKRKRPGRHTVHTKDSRYNVPSYPRGKGDLVTRHGVTKTQHAWDVDDGMVAEPIYHRPTDEWRGDHNRSDVVDVDYHASKGEPVLDKATIIYANDEKDARSKVEARFGKVKKVEPLGVNPMGNPYYRVTFIPKKNKRKSSRSLSSSKKKGTFPNSKMFGNKEYILSTRIPRNKGSDEERVLRRLGIRYQIIADGDSYVFYTHKGDEALRRKQVIPEKPSKDVVERFKKKYKIHEEDWKDPFKGLVMNDDKTMGLVVEPKEVFKDLPTDPYKGRVSTFINVDLPITARSDHIKVRSVKGKDRKAGHFEMIMVGNNVVQANKLREAISIVGQDDIIFRAERKDYPVAIQNSKGDTIMLAPLVGMTSKEEEKNLPRLENLEGVESTSLTE